MQAHEHTQEHQLHDEFRGFMAQIERAEYNMREDAIRVSSIHFTAAARFKKSPTLDMKSRCIVAQGLIDRFSEDFARVSVEKKNLLNPNPNFNPNHVQSLTARNNAAIALAKKMFLICQYLKSGVENLRFDNVIGPKIILVNSKKSPPRRTCRPRSNPQIHRSPLKRRRL